VNIGSVIGSTGNVGQTAYCASKAGLVGMQSACASLIGGITKTWAKELAPKRIRVNIIEPGFILTDMTRCKLKDFLNSILLALPEAKREALLAEIPLKRFGTPEVWLRFQHSVLQ
jgi:3-oxoacyl-[acyl-carrier protein] reductase